MVASPFVRLFSAIVILLAVSPAFAADHPWMSDKTLLQAAQKEGEVVFFSSYNEDEMQARTKFFSEATGIKASYIRGGDEALIARITIAARAGKQIWDGIEITNAHGLPDDWTLVFTPDESSHLIPLSVDPRHRWFGTEVIFHAPGYNPTRIAKSALPTSYEDFANHPELKGHVAVEATDRWWIAGLFQHYGEQKATSLIENIVRVVDPIVYISHIGLARAVASGEYWISLNNYLNLTITVQKAGDPIDYWVLDPVVVNGHQYAVNANGLHPKAAQLLGNYLISVEGQTQNAKAGRIPTRLDVPTDPPGLFDILKTHQTVAPVATAEEDSRWQKKFDQLFKKN